MRIEIVRESDDKLNKQRWIFESGRDPFVFFMQRYDNMTRLTRRFHYKVVEGGGWVPKPADVMEEARQRVIEMITIR